MTNHRRKNIIAAVVSLVILFLIFYCGDGMDEEQRSEIRCREFVMKVVFPLGFQKLTDYDAYRDLVDRCLLNEKTRREDRKKNTWWLNLVRANAKNKDSESK